MASEKKAVERAKEGELVEQSFIHYVPILVVGICICFVPSAILNSCAGIYYTACANDLGVEVSQVSIWRTIDYITGFIVTPIAGTLLAKYNTKYIILASAAIESCVFILFGLSPNLMVMYVGGGIAGITNAIMLGVGIAAILNRWFRTSTGLVIGIAMSCTGFGGMFWTAIGQSIIDSSGWRTSYIELGIISLIIMVIVVLTCMTNRPEDKGWLPYGTAKAAAKAETESKSEIYVPCVRPSVARKSLLLVVFVILGFLINSVCNINSFFAAYIEWYDSQSAVVNGVISGAFITGAQLTIANSAGNATGKIGLGLISDFNIIATFLIMCGCGMIGLLFMWQFPSSVLLPIGGFLMGIFIAAVLVVMPMIARRCFGNGASYPVIWSYVGMSLALGGACGSYIWARIAEAAGGYGATFTVALIMMAVIAILGIIVYSMRDKLPREELTEDDLD